MIDIALMKTLRVNVPRDRSCTRHLLVVAMSQPVTTSPGHSHQGFLSGVESWQSIALSLHQVRDHLAIILRVINLTSFITRSRIARAST